MMKLLFDANVSPHAIAKLLELSETCKEKVEIRHLVQDFPQDTPDSGFISKYAAEGYIIVTGDSAKQSGRSDRLPKICAEEGATHVLFTGKLQQRRTFDKMRAVMTVWPDLIEAYEAEPGSRFKLQQTHKSFRLVAA